MIRAKDIMSRKIATVGEDANVMDIIRVLVRNKITGVPVVSQDQRLSGIVTEKDILGVLLWDKDVKEKTAKELMTTEITCFDEDEDLMNVYKCLVESSFRRVPILSEGKLVGIISRADIIHLLSKKAGGTAKSESNEVESQKDDSGQMTKV
jgi:CBS domain-containing protein